VIDGATQEFGPMLRRLRLRAGLSQEELAERAGLSADSISALERGTRRAPYDSTRHLLAAALGLTREETAQWNAAGRRLRPPRPAPTRIDGGQVRLPAYATSFFGRAGEQQTLVATLSRSRIVTVCGPGGVGKTRLAIEVAAAFAPAVPEGVRFVALASLRDPAFAHSIVAAALDIASGGSTSSLEAIVALLRDREVLLLLDNCEHVAEAIATVVEALIRGCPRVRILATSREPLLVDGETLHRLEPLDIADAAVALFLDRATAATTLGAARFSHEAAAEVARRLDGIPLAIELAAALTRTHHENEILAMLGGPAFLREAERRTAVEHQRTLRATLGWSYDLLSEAERTALRALSYPAAGTTAAGARALCGPQSAPDIRRLIDTSLLLESQPADRLKIHETTRTFAASLAGDAEMVHVADRQARWLGSRMRDAFTAGLARVVLRTLRSISSRTGQRAAVL